MKVVILTGVSRGIGKALHDRLVLKDVFLIFIGRNFSKLLSTEKSLYLEADLEYLDLSILTKISESISRFTNIDKIIFINNAAIVTPIGLIGDYTIDEIVRSEKINSIAPKMIVNNLASFSRKHQYKLLIMNISSGASTRPISGWSMYCSTKSSLRSFLDVVSEDDSSISVIHYDPGVVDTDMQEQIRNSNEVEFPAVLQFKHYKQNHKLVKPESVAVDILRVLGL